MRARARFFAASIISLIPRTIKVASKDCFKVQFCLLTIREVKVKIHIGPPPAVMPLPSINTLIVPFIVKPIVDGIALWTLDQLDTAQCDSTLKNCLKTAAQVAMIAVMALNAWIAIQGLAIGGSMLQDVLYFQYQMRNVSLLLGATAFCSIVYIYLQSWIFIETSNKVLKSYYRHVNEMYAPASVNLSLKYWLHFSFQSLNPFFWGKHICFGCQQYL